MTRIPGTIGAISAIIGVDLHTEANDYSIYRGIIEVKSKKKAVTGNT